ncbi:MAG: MFS transporter [Solirubrobacteraceae bacterium]
MSALRDRRFRRLWVAGLISDTGDWLLLVSLPIVVFRDTGSALGTAVTFLVELAPPVVLAPIAGSIADQSDRRRTLMLVSIAQAVLLMPLLLVHGRGGLPLIYLVVASQAGLASVFDPTKSALLPTLVGADQLVSANSLVGLNQNVGRLIGGSLGGALLAVGGGLSLIVAGDVTSFLIAAALIATLSTRATPPRPHPSATEAEPAGGWAATLAAPRVRAGLVVVGIASIAQGMFLVLFILFVARVLHGDSGEIGLLRGVQAIGAIAAGMLLAAAVRIRAGALTAAAALAFGCVSLAVWNAPHLTAAEPLYVVLFIVVGAPGVALVTGLTSTMQQATQEGQRGKVFAAMGVAMALGEAAGLVVAGGLGNSLPVVDLLDAQGTLYLISGVVAWRWLARHPRSRRSTPTTTTAAATMTTSAKPRQRITGRV